MSFRFDAIQTKRASRPDAPGADSACACHLQGNLAAMFTKMVNVSRALPKNSHSPKSEIRLQISLLKQNRFGWDRSSDHFKA